jgi:uncharacterized protein
VELNLDSIAVQNNEAAQRFEANIDGQLAVLTYRLFPHHLVLDHTEVPKPLAGQGLGTKLVRAALDFAGANHLRVVPLCPFVAGYLRRHPEYQDLLSTDDLQQVLSR